MHSNLLHFEINQNLDKIQILYTYMYKQLKLTKINLTILKV